jgi:glycosyltransferase involved in cell wall biosynthesis
MIREPLGTQIGQSPMPPLPENNRIANENSNHGMRRLGNTRSQQLRISVALCTFNGEQFLRKQLESIFSQTRLPDEVVICDDDSSDSTLEILESFAVSAPFPFRVERNAPRLGTTQNFAKAIQLCSGDLIALCDQDDFWGPNKIETQARYFEGDSSLGGLISDAILVNSESLPIGRTLWESIEFDSDLQRSVREGKAASALLNRNFVTGATMMFRSELAPKFLPIPSRWVHDAWIAWLIVLNSKLDIAAEPLSFYRTHPGQQCGVLPAPLDRMRKSQEVLAAQCRAVAEQLEDLSRYLETANGSAKTIWLPLVKEKIHHLFVRSDLPSNRFARLFYLVPEIGNYRRFSKGWKSMLKDLVVD